jgi:hypothetical protein
MEMTTQRSAPIKKQPSSNAQRQADYRLRHLKSQDRMLERLSVLVDLHAKRALERLALCYGVTQKSMLQSLIVQAENAAIVEALALSPNGQADFYEGRLRLPLASVKR